MTYKFNDLDLVFTVVFCFKEVEELLIKISLPRNLKLLEDVLINIDF